MADPSSKVGRIATASEEPAAYLDMPPQRRALAKAHAAMLAETAGRVVLELPFSADVDDFRRVLVTGAKDGAKP
jgi:glucose-6-phosphate 1-dehydrogenase